LRPFVKRFALCYRTVVLSVPSYLSVMLVYSGQTVGWIKMKLGVQVGLSPGHIVLDGDPAPPPQMGIAPTFRPMSVVAKRLDRSKRCHLVWRWASAQATLSFPKSSTVPNFRPMSVVWPNGRPSQPLLSTCISRLTSVTYGRHTCTVYTCHTCHTYT